MGFIVNTCIEVYKRLKRRFTPQLRHSQYGNLSAMPFRASSFALVSANMVVEHLSERDTFGQALLGPVVLLEFFLIWLTEWPPLRALRSNLVVVLEKRPAAVAPPLKTADVQAGRPAA